MDISKKVLLNLD